MRKFFLLVISLSTIIMISACTSQPTVGSGKVKQEVLSGNDIKPFSIKLGSLISTGDSYSYTYTDSTVSIEKVK